MGTRSVSGGGFCAVRVAWILQHADASSVSNNAEVRLALARSCRLISQESLEQSQSRQAEREGGNGRRKDNKTTRRCRLPSSYLLAPTASRRGGRTTFLPSTATPLVSNFTNHSIQPPPTPSNVPAPSSPPLTQPLTTRHLLQTTQRWPLSDDASGTDPSHDTTRLRRSSPSASGGCWRATRLVSRRREGSGIDRGSACRWRGAVHARRAGTEKLLYAVLGRAGLRPTTKHTTALMTLSRTALTPPFFDRLDLHHRPARPGRLLYRQGRLQARVLPHRHVDSTHVRSERAHIVPTCHWTRRRDPSRAYSYHRNDLEEELLGRPQRDPG